MSEFEFSAHASTMLMECQIPEEWVQRTCAEPDQVETGVDGNLHYMRSIPEHGGRVLRVVINASVNPRRIVTLFFHRRLKRSRGQHET